MPLIHDTAHAFVPYPDAPVPHAATGPLSGLCFAAKDLKKFFSDDLLSEATCVEDKHAVRENEPERPSLRYAFAPSTIRKEPRKVSLV